MTQQARWMLAARGISGMGNRQLDGDDKERKTRMGGPDGGLYPTTLHWFSCRKTPVLFPFRLWSISGVNYTGCPLIPPSISIPWPIYLVNSYFMSASRRGAAPATTNYNIQPRPRVSRVREPSISFGGA
jgi:hypothetical protein